MRRLNAVLLVALIGSAALTGCANARYVKSDQGSGVVAMPANSNCWPNYYRDHAEALIRQKCPEGYEVVYEEEAVVGQVTNTHTDTDVNKAPTLNFGGGNSDTNKNGNSEHGSSSFAGLAVPVGTTHEKTRQTTDSRDVTEWRIYYRAKSPGPPAAAGTGGPLGPMSSRPGLAPPS